MTTSSTNQGRRTSADMVFDRLYDDIISLELLPGTKLSEADVAIQFGVSRQPVRDAFNRLGSRGLLRIQPQRATQVEKFSLKSINTARFVRLAIELENIRLATAQWKDSYRDRFEDNLEAQTRAVEQEDVRGFHTLDEDFHKAISEVADTRHAFELALRKKAQIDRLCVLSLKQPHEMIELVNDHLVIYEAMSSGDQSMADARIRSHLKRIENIVEKVRQEYGKYFEG